MYIMEKYGIVYLWYDKKHKRFYIGCHWGFEDDGYICSSSWMINSYKRRQKDFKRRILSRIYYDRNALLDKEAYWLSFIKQEELGKKYYNIRKHRWTRDCTIPTSIETRKKMSDSRMGIIYSEETKERMRQAQIGKRYSSEVNSKKGHEVGYSQKEETKRKISETRKLRRIRHSPEVLKIIAEKLQGRTLSEEHRRKIGEACTVEVYCIGCQKKTKPFYLLRGHRTCFNQRVA